MKSSHSDILIESFTSDAVCWHYPLQYSPRCSEATIGGHPRRNRGSMPQCEYLRIHKFVAQVSIATHPDRVKRAYVYSFLPFSGFDTEVGGKGSQLSGGQKRKWLDEIYSSHGQRSNSFILLFVHFIRTYCHCASITPQSQSSASG